MPGFTSYLRSFHLQEEGATATEYIILVVLIACFLITAVTLFGEAVAQKFTDSTNQIETEVVVTN